ncbi:MAG TPA: potassium transporter Kup [Chitinophagaceae bacterium]|nr:potassium transporter Kup [Chitinophagaceae bacterium]
MSNNNLKSNNNLLKLTIGALGIVFGDIGTSPLYAMRVCFEGAHGIAITDQNIYGVLSMIFWSLILVISVKYLIIILRADNKGEGGILALMKLVLPAKKKTKYFVILSMGLFGAALLYGDGMITPAISVLSALEGLQIATPFFEPFIIPFTIIILFILFFFQRKGTGKVGMVFGPVIIIWFASLALMGINAIVKHPSVLYAINPYYAFHFFLVYGFGSITILGAVFLVVTGGEAIYADIGHFGRKPIRLGWFYLVLPCLVLNYFGQGALLLGNHNFISNPFYYLAPVWALYPLVILAALATVIASQAVLSGAFSVTYQAIQLGFMPRLKVVHTSEDESGQIYIPQLNWMLFLATISLVASFKTSDNLAGAYGMAVTTTMVITTLLAFLAMRNLWKWNLAAAVSLTIFFLIIDLSFFAANIVKIPHGGWFPLVIAGLFYFMMATWHKGKRMMSIQLEKVIDPLKKFQTYYQKNVQHIVDGTAIYLARDPSGTPSALVFNLMHNKVLHEKVIILSVQFIAVPHVKLLENVEINELDKYINHIIIYYGYLDKTDIPDSLQLLEEKGLAIDQKKVTYFLGRDSIVIAKHTGMSPLRETLFNFMGRNSVKATRYFNLPSEKVCIIGSQIRL